MYQSPITVKDTLERVRRHDIVLPAIQREFVWQAEQICRLFDSLLQGYPFGTFLFWKVNRENSNLYQFYDFVLDYHQRDDPHCPRLGEMEPQDVTAVLDGQQRLTALNIGLRGSIATKLPYKRWANPDAFPRRRLWLDLLWRQDDDDGDILHRFEFLTSEQAADRSDGSFWYPVHEIMDVIAGPPMVKWLNKQLDQDAVDVAYEELDLLYRTIHDKHIVSFYEERSQELDKVLQIFIRTNSGGTALAYSDLLLSVAVAQWEKHEAREEIHKLVDELNRVGNGFSFSKDFVLKAGLMLSDIGSVGFKVDNFNKHNMSIFEDRWSGIQSSLLLTVQLVSGFGFDGQTIRADSALLPIAYYMYTKNRKRPYLTSGKYRDDRRTIRKWLVASVLKASGIWGSGLDTLLTLIRADVARASDDRFPDVAIRRTMGRRGKSLAFTEEEVDELVELRYGDRRTFALLSLLVPSLDLRNHFHVDHVFPKSAFTPRKLRKAGVSPSEIEDFREWRDQLPNLQLLEGAINHEKSATLPRVWLKSTFRNRQHRRHYCETHLLGDVPKEMAEFGTFFSKRRARLAETINGMLRERRE